MFLYALCLVLILFEVLWWTQTSVVPLTKGSLQKETAVSKLLKVDNQKEGQVTKYLLDDISIPKVPLEKSQQLAGQRLVLRDNFTSTEKALLFLTDSDVVFLEEVLPKEGENGTISLQHNTCAFVGNSLSLLSEDRGSEIDRHQAVLRFIDGTSTKYDAFVGRKRTYLPVTKNHIYTFVPEIGNAFVKAKKPRSKVLLVYGDVPFQEYAELRKIQPDVHAYYLSPAFEMRVRKVYQQILERMMRLGENVDGAASGGEMPQALIPLFFMKSICKIVSVYGFTVPLASDHLYSPNVTYYGQARSESESAHGKVMQYLLRLLSLEGHIELVS